jgi:Fe-S-cluster containining protein
MAAKLYKLQNEIDAEIDKQKNENDLNFKCREGCSECCSRCYCVSETEFVLILNYIIKNWPQERIIRIIDNSKSQWETLEKQYPAYAEKINGSIPLSELIKLDSLVLPFPCIFLNDSGLCSIYQVRPLKCRLHGTGYLDPLAEGKPCSLLPKCSSATDKFADLSKFIDAVSGFTFLRVRNGVIFRRPMPLFFYFNLIFRDSGIYDFINTDMYHDLILLEENDYINNLI